MTLYKELINGADVFISVHHVVDIYTSGSMYQTLSQYTQPKKTKFAESNTIGAPTWKVWVFTFSSWNSSELVEDVPELKKYIDMIMINISYKNTENWPEYCPNPKWFPYQREGVEWLLKNKGGMICDEMGLGKTIQAIGFMDNSPYKHAVIICPASMLYTWQKEIETWSDWVGVVLDNKRKITKATKEGSEHRDKTAFIMSWGGVGNHFDKMINGAIKPELLICDESHYAKNIEAKRTLGVMAISRVVDSTILLSGTPMRNCAIDLFPQLHMVAPKNFSDFNDFANNFAPPRERSFGRNSFVVYDRSINLGELRKQSRPHMIFRKKKDVLKDLPSKRYGRIQVNTPKSLEKEWSEIIEAAKSGQEIDSALMIAHRQNVGSHKASVIGEWLIDNSSKDNPVVVFIVHSCVRVVLESILEKEGITYKCIVGSTPNNARKTIIEDFQDGKIQVLICSEAGKEGITLTKSSSLVQLERFWVPADEEQAEARIWRIGQKSKVLISHAHAKGTIDDFIVSKLARKREVINEVFQDAKIDEKTFSVLERAFENLF